MSDTAMPRGLSQLGKSERDPDIRCPPGDLRSFGDASSWRVVAAVALIWHGLCTSTEVRGASGGAGTITVDRGRTSA